MPRLPPPAAQPPPPLRTPIHMSTCIIVPSETEGGKRHGRIRVSGRGDRETEGGIRTLFSARSPTSVRSRRTTPCRPPALAHRGSTTRPATTTSSTATPPTASWNRSSKVRSSRCRLCSSPERAPTRARKPISPRSSKATIRASSRLTAIGRPTARKTTLSAESSSTCSYAGRKALSPNSEM